MAVSLAARAFIFPLAMAGFLQLFSLHPALAQAESLSQAPSTDATVFECIPADNPGQYATIARRGQLVTPPMILWQQVQYYTPQQRCQIVSDRLSGAVKASGGRFGNLLLTYGNVNQQSVICYVQSRTGSCNNDNILLTLRPEDQGHELEILTQLVTFGTEASGSPLVRGGPPPRQYAALGEELKQYLGDDPENSGGI